jgi:hypothetical protein
MKKCKFNKKVCITTLTTFQLDATSDLWQHCGMLTELDETRLVNTVGYL